MDGVTLKDLRGACPTGSILSDWKTGNSHTCEVEAPPGQLWKASGTHSLVAAAYRPWKPDYQDLKERVAYGIEPCTDPGCEWCSE